MWLAMTCERPGHFELWRPLTRRGSGGMVAHAYAVQFPEHTASVCWGECPLPGSKIYQERK